MPEPWRIYLDGLQLGRTDAIAHAWARDEILRERAHDAYRATTDALTSDGWDSEDALTLTRGFGQDVKSWLDAGGRELEELRARLEARWEAWQRNGGPSVDRR